MKLGDFVKQSLLEITQGVVEAAEEAEVTIAPSHIEGKPLFEPQLVTFDLSVTQSAESGGGISVLAAFRADATSQKQHSNTISFSVPIHFNSQNVRKVDRGTT